jgi:glyoxylase-like metal-dependent hydrolase (beta-lactamase superfamily II)
VSPRFEILDPASIEYGRVDQVSPLVRRVIAKNPSKFTYLGTGTYIVGSGDIVVIDPGPILDSHRDALARAIEGERVLAILVTHCHSDHSPLAAWLKAETGAPTVAYGPHPRPDMSAGRRHDWSEIDEALAPPPEPEPDPDSPEGKLAALEREAAEEAGGEPKMEESTDHDFTPDLTVRTGDVAAEGPGFTITAVHTPGHTSNHTCFALAEERALFTGDHVMGWSTTVVGPPDGDMSAYMRSLAVVADRADEVLWPTHGPCRTDGAEYTRALVEHRLERERQVLAAIEAGHRTIPEMVKLLYAAVHPQLHRPAARSTFAHLQKLIDDGRVVDEGDPAHAPSSSVFRVVA